MTINTTQLELSYFLLDNMKANRNDVLKACVTLNIQKYGNHRLQKVLEELTIKQKNQVLSEVLNSWTYQ
ncbi:Pumilio-family RNA binding repeat-containing protein [Lactobacillus acetotolerans]|uniref:Pumilio-family RNA binding repeat-containing protein n=1 Tax=Lactobacillus acetotolerans TaxID=1600 RepID=UPI002FDA5C9D